MLTGLTIHLVTIRQRAANIMARLTSRPGVSLRGAGGAAVSWDDGSAALPDAEAVSMSLG